jgi:hypothetical protein
MRGVPEQHASQQSLIKDNLPRAEQGHLEQPERIIGIGTVLEDLPARAEGLPTRRLGSATPCGPQAPQPGEQIGEHGELPLSVVEGVGSLPRTGLPRERERSTSVRAGREPTSPQARRPDSEAPSARPLRFASRRTVPVDNGLSRPVNGVRKTGPGSGAAGSGEDRGSDLLLARLRLGGGRPKRDPPHQAGLRSGS